MALRFLPKRVVKKSNLGLVLVRVSNVVKGHHDHYNSYKGEHFIGAGVWFKDLVHCYHGGKQGKVHAEHGAKE